MKKQAIFIAMAAMTVEAQAAANDWDRLIEGGRFMDRILPMQGEQLSSDCWGAPSTKPRLVDNGIESPDTSFWGGNIVRGDDGLYHMNVAGWLESSSRGHNTWSQSDTYHAVSEQPWGPFRVTATLGKGHNPETYRAKDGRWVCYVIDARYISDDIAGPWERSTFEFDQRDRDILSGLSNITFATRQDSSMLAIDRGGSVWISRDGISAYRQIADHSVYSGNKRYFEDPVVWRDSLQYHMIVNDWNARIAYYSRSLDGLHWVTEQGEAYLPGCSRHEDGSVEEWYKYERAKVYLDETGRAAQINFAVIDTIKNEDKASDNHSSKNITMPLNRGLLLEVLNHEPIDGTTAEIRVLVKAEAGFDPLTQLDTESIVFGNYNKVNYGEGCRVKAVETQGSDLVLVFNGEGSGIDATEFAPKLIGRDTEGRMIYGYARLPYVNYRPAILSALRPQVSGMSVASVVVENFGLSASAAAVISVTDNKGTLLATGTVESIAPYGQTTVNLTAVADIPASATGFNVTFADGEGTTIDTNTFGINDITAARATLQELIDQANTLLAGDGYLNGRAALEQALADAQAVIASFSVTDINASVEAMKRAINDFNFANATADNPKQVGLENGDMAALDGWTIDRAESPTFTLNTRHTYDNFSSPFAETWVSQSGALGVDNCMWQTVNDCPAGLYRLTAAVIAVRQGNGSDATNVELFINDKAEPCHTANQAPELYTINYTMPTDGDITVGLRIGASTNANWVAWDNVRLEYLGTPAVTAISSVASAAQTSEGYVYDLAGRRVANATDSMARLPQGIYVMNGRKMAR